MMRSSRFLCGLSHAARRERCFPRQFSNSRALHVSCPVSSSSSNSSSNNNSSSNELPAEADVVIIGGGSVGCQTLYHLTKLGVTSALLLERHKLTAGTTWHTAGLLWRLRPSDTEIQLINRSLEVFTSLEEETGVDPGWMGNGGLFIANNKERLDEYRRLHSVGLAFGIESSVLSPSECKNVVPLLNVDDMYGALHSPMDGTVTPEVCTALARAARRAGARVLEGCSVTGIGVADDGSGRKTISSVETNLGTVRTRAVVNCAGAWGAKVAAMVDGAAKLPLVAMKHAYVTTEGMQGVPGMPNIRDHDASVYLKVQGDALHIGGYEQNPEFWDDVKDDFSFSLFDLDWSVFSAHISGAVNRVPAVGQTGIKSTVCGPESFTPDHKPLLGEDPAVRGLFHGCGFNSAGLMLGGGCGEQLAYWIRDGRPQLDMYSYDIRRFCPSVSSSKDWVRQRSHESYAKNYSMVFPHDEPLAGRAEELVKTSPIHEQLAEAGCVFQERLGWERPGRCTPQPYDWYGAYQDGEAGGESESTNKERHPYVDRLEMDYTFGYPKHHRNIQYESLSARLGAAVFDYSYFGKFFIGGENAQKAADWIFSNNMSVAGGKTVYTCMLNRRAGIEADLTVSVIDGNDGAPEGGLNPFKGSRSFYVAAAGGSAFHSLTHIRQSLQDANLTSGIEVSDLTASLGVLSLQGPASRAVLRNAAPSADWDDEAFPPNEHRVVDVGGIKVRALRVSFVGELGWELHCPREDAATVYRRLKESGEEAGFPVADAGFRALDALSAEKGYPHWHGDVRMDDNPLESGLMFTCKLKSETDFLGRGALEGIKARGAKKRKICLIIDKPYDDESDSDPPPALLGLEAILRDGVPVGFVRRGDYAHYLDRPIAFGYVSDPSGAAVTADWLRRGDFQLESMGRRFGAHAHLRSPFDPAGDRIRGAYPQEETLEGNRERLRILKEKLQY